MNIEGDCGSERNPFTSVQYNFIKVIFLFLHSSTFKSYKIFILCNSFLSYCFPPLTCGVILFLSSKSVAFFFSFCLICLLVCFFLGDMFV